MLIVSIVIIIAALMIFYEYRQPGREFPKVRNWWIRALCFNSLQVIVVYIAGVSWDRWMSEMHPTSIRSLGDFWGSLIAYFVLTFFFYWWHRWRHANLFLWRWVHQVHHSPQRLEIATAFYKHPFEFLSDSLICSIGSYIILGISPIAGSGAALLLGLAELVYHWNVKTPRWLGYFFQRPESHCIHHQMGLHAYNYADLPLWDMLFGTFRNPKTWRASCGIGEDEHRVGKLLMGHDLTDRSRKQETYFPSYFKKVIPVVFLLTLGLLQMGADLFHQPKLKGLAAAWGASPCPKVFTSIDGLETFSSRFFLVFSTPNGDRKEIEITKQLAKHLKGPYNRRNVYGALLSHGPILKNHEKTKNLYLSAIDYALNQKQVLLKELGIDSAEISGDVELITLPKGESL